MKSPRLPHYLISLIILFSYSLPAAAQERYLLVLDVQERFIKGQPYEQDALQMVERVNDLAVRFDREKVVYVKSTGKSLSISGRGIRTEAMPVPPFDSRLRVVNDQVFVKVSTGDAFSSDSLVAFLRGRNAREMVVVGLLAEKCVSSTLLGGLKKGFDMIVVPEAVAGKSAVSRDKVMEKMKKKGIRVVPFGDLVKVRG